MHAGGLILSERKQGSVSQSEYDTWRLKRHASPIIRHGPVPEGLGAATGMGLRPRQANRIADMRTCLARSFKLSKTLPQWWQVLAHLREAGPRRRRGPTPRVTGRLSRRLLKGLHSRLHGMLNAVFLFVERAVRRIKQARGLFLQLTGFRARLLRDQGARLAAGSRCDEQCNSRTASDSRQETQSSGCVVHHFLSLSFLRFVTLPLSGYAGSPPPDVRARGSGRSLFA